MADPRFTENDDNSGRLLKLAYLTPAYAATLAIAPNASKTIYKVALTGNMTVNVTETDCAIGDEIVFLFTTDGARTVTFGTNMKPSATLVSGASKETSATFMYDGANFVETARAVAA
jgi:plastocyanin